MPTPAVRVLPSIKGLSPFGDEEIHVSHLPPEEQQLLRKVETAAKGAIRETELPSLPNILTVDGNEPIEVSAVPANAEAVQAAAGATGVVPGPMPTSLEPVLKMMSPETLEEISTSLKEGLDRLHGAEDEGQSLKELVEIALPQTKHENYNPAREIVMAMLASERHMTNNRLRREKEEIIEIEGQLKILSKLGAQLRKLPSDKASHKLSADTVSLLAQVKEMKLDLFFEVGKNNEISREDLTALKDRIIDVNGELKQKIPDRASNMATIVEMLKSILASTRKAVEEQKELYRFISDHTGR